MSQLRPTLGPDDHVLGGDRAAITLVEYGDYECPHCGRAEVILRRILDELGDELTYGFRHFPLSQIHPHAARAAEAAEAAGARDRFWPMHHLLFEHQEALETEHLLGYARGLGLDVVRFGRELEEGNYAERVRADFLSGLRSGVHSTPTFFINGVRHDGSWSYDALMAALGRAGAAAAP